MNQRAGISLAEVLIAIFVLALSLLGVLSLFPLGAVRMAQAVKDDRTATLNHNTSAVMHQWWREETDTLKYGTSRPEYNPVPGPYNTIIAPNPIPPDRYDAFFNAMEDVNFPWNPDLADQGLGGVIPPAFQAPPATRPPVLSSRSWFKPSYPVFVDPIGWNAFQNVGNLASQFWVGGSSLPAPQNTQTIPRRSLRRFEWTKNALNQYVVPVLPAARIVYMNRYLTLLDDIGFGRDGTPTDSTGANTAGQLGVANMLGQVQRDGYYNCAFLIRRDQTNNITAAQMTVVVYQKRSFDTPATEIGFIGARFYPGSNEAKINYVGTKPDLRRGRWILDATMVNPNYAPNDYRYPEPHGYFYRIIGVREEIPGELTLELQDPVPNRPEFGTINQQTGAGYGVAVYMDGVSEVFAGRILSPEVRPVP